MTEVKRVLIVGGVAGGASAAGRARRLSEDAEIVLYERGEHISFANCGLPYHIGGTIRSRERLLLQTPESMNERFRIDVRVSTEVKSIDAANKKITAVDLLTGEEFEDSYDALVLSPGAEPVRPPIPGIDDPRIRTLRNISDMDAIIDLVERDSVDDAVIVGGGYIGLEMAEALRQRKMSVTLVELSDQVMGPADPEMASFLHNELKFNAVDLKLGTSVTGFEDSGDDLYVRLSDGGSLKTGLVILAIGVRPETKLARDAGLTIGKTGGILVDDRMRTSDPNIFAVGDAVEVRDFITGDESLIPLAGPANRQGRIAADNIFGREAKYQNTLGTAICKLFNLAIGMTGASEKTLKKSSTRYEKIYIHPDSHAGYYPGSSPISLKLIFDPDDGKILGAQAVGADGVDKRIDVIATAIRSGMTVFDLEHLELSYAPPYGSAKDPINHAGFVASNMIRGDARFIHVEELLNLGDDQVLIDVRTTEEIEAGMIPGAIHIPVDELRDRLDEIDREKEIIISCAVGVRGYVACRMLSQRGFNCRNLSGGYKTYMMFKGNECADVPLKDHADDKSTEKECGSENGCSTPKAVAHIDACGLQCPGPIKQLKAQIDKICVGDAVVITASDPGFAADIPAWCSATGNELAELVCDKGTYRATIVKRGNGTAPSSDAIDPSTKKGTTIVVFSSDFDKMMAAFIIANGSAAMGHDVTLFFTFWGLNVLRRDNPVDVKKTPIEKMFGWMMPRGPKKLAMSKMHMAGMGLSMIKGIMKEKNVSSLPELIKSAQESGVKLVSCAMSMDLMGIKPEELIDGVEIGGVAMYLGEAESGRVNLFI